MHERRFRGKTAEIFARYRLMSEGYMPCTPPAPTKYDLVIDTVDGIKKIQVKSSTMSGNTPSANLSEKGKKYPIGSIDYFMLVDEPAVYIIPRRCEEATYCSLAARLQFKEAWHLLPKARID